MIGSALFVFLRTEFLRREWEESQQEALSEADAQQENGSLIPLY